MNIDFTNEVSTYNKEKFGILPPGKQFWDGLEPEEKNKKTLVVVKTHKTADGKDEYDKLVIKKEDKNKSPIKGIMFCIVDTEESTNCQEEYGNWVTDGNGKIEIPVNELPLYNTYLYEVESYGEPKSPKGEPTLSSKKYTSKHIPLYVDPGNRFLGELKGKDFIKYDELIATIDGEPNPEKKEYKIGYTTKIGKVSDKAEDKSTGGNWLKFYDGQNDRIIYVAKKPITYKVGWDMLYSAGVVYGLDMLDNQGKPKSSEIPSTYKGRMISITGKNI